MRAAVARAVLILMATMLADLVHADGELPRRGQLGVRLAPESESGVMVDDAVSPGSAAEEHGIRPGDVIVAVDGVKLKEPRGLIEVLSPMRAGRSIAVTIQRDSQHKTLSPSLKEPPRDRGANFEVLYHHVVSGGARIRTLVSRPTKPGRYPVLFFIAGMGPVSIDEPLSGQSAESRIVGAFADADYVTVRVEKPGVGDSEGGPYGDIDFETELDTYRQALKAITSRACALEEDDPQSDQAEPNQPAGTERLSQPHKADQEDDAHLCRRHDW